MTFAVGFAAGGDLVLSMGINKDRRHLEEELQRERAKNARLAG